MPHHRYASWFWGYPISMLCRRGPPVNANGDQYPMDHRCNDVEGYPPRILARSECSSWMGWVEAWRSLWLNPWCRWGWRSSYRNPFRLSLLGWVSPIWKLNRKRGTFAVVPPSTWRALTRVVRNRLRFGDQCSQRIWREHQQWKQQLDCPLFRTTLWEDFPNFGTPTSRRDVGCSMHARTQLSHQSFRRWDCCGIPRRHRGWV